MVRLHDLLPMEFMCNDIRIYVDEVLAYDDRIPKCKRYRAFTSYFEYEVYNIVIDEVICIYLRRK